MPSTRRPATNSSGDRAETPVCSRTLALEQFLTFRLGALSNALQTRVTRHYIAPASPVGLTEWRLMGQIQRHGELHASALSRLSLMDKAQISRALQPLIDRGWVLSRADPMHARRQLLQLSASGQAVFDTVLARARPYQAALLNALTREERAMLDRILDKLDGASLALDNGLESGPAASPSPTAHDELP
ncbi:MAG: MarR family winged helix-turn-helix transcriptional regulator [Burkholderiaceae bacterium]|nr:MarR family winged helix-turn-helix transcriptional regulator [Burkholderiaceae bacterium]